jgi:hypothetical protein
MEQQAEDFRFGSITINLLQNVLELFCDEDKLIGDN